MYHLFRFPFSRRTKVTSSVATTGGGWAPDPSGSPSKARPNTVASRDVVKRCAELAAKAREITGPACTRAELRSSTWIMTIEPWGGERLASLNLANNCRPMDSIFRRGHACFRKQYEWTRIIWDRRSLQQKVVQTLAFDPSKYMSFKVYGHMMTVWLSFLMEMG